MYGLRGRIEVKHFAGRGGVFLTNQQSERGAAPSDVRAPAGRTVILDRCENTRLEKGALRKIRLRVCSECLNQDKLTFGRVKYLASGSGVFIADQHFEPEATPCQMIAHAAGGVRLDHGIDAGGFEHTLGKVRLSFRPEGLNQNEFAVVHKAIICQSGILPWQATAVGQQAWELDQVRGIAQEQYALGRAKARLHPFKMGSISRNRRNSRYNSPLGLRE